jgi:uncharacterized membrane protein
MVVERDFKHGMISVSLILAAFLSLVIATPVSATTATPPDNYVAVPQGGVLLLRSSITFNKAATGYFVWGPIYWYNNGDPTENFCLENTPSVYWNDTLEDVENVTIQDYYIFSGDYGDGWQIEIKTNGNGIERNGTFTIDIWLRAASGDGTRHKAESQWIYFALDAITLFEPSLASVSAPQIYVDVTEVISRGMEVSISPGYQSGVPCTTLDYTVTVNNTGTVQENYTLAKSDDAGWGDEVTLDNGWLVVQPGENQTTTLHVHIPNDAIACTEDNIIVTATSKENAEIENSASCTAHVTAKIRGVNVLIEPIYQSALVGESIEYTVTVTNTGNVSDTYDLEATDNAALNWAPTLAENLLENVPPGENKGVILTVIIPDGAENCTRDNINVIARSQENSEIENGDSCIAHATTLRILRVDVSISPHENWAENGETVTFTVTVTNRGTVSDNYDLEASDDASWTPAISPERLSLVVGGSGTATLSVAIPEDAENCTRDNITVTARSQENVEIENTTSCVAHCLVGVPPPLRGVEISISPLEKGGAPGENVTFIATITNLGSAQDSFDLTVSDDLNWAPTLDENLLVNVTPGDSQTITLRVTIPENAAACTRDNIRVRATSHGDHTVSAEGSCTPHAIVREVSRWSSILIAVLIAGAVLAVGYLARRR